MHVSSDAYSPCIRNRNRNWNWAVTSIAFALSLATLNVPVLADQEEVCPQKLQSKYGSVALQLPPNSLGVSLQRYNDDDTSNVIQMPDNQTMLHGSTRTLEFETLSRLDSNVTLPGPQSALLTKRIEKSNVTLPGSQLALLLKRIGNHSEVMESFAASAQSPSNASLGGLQTTSSMDSSRINLILSAVIIGFAAISALCVRRGYWDTTITSDSIIVLDTMSYKTQGLLSWKILYLYENTVWSNNSLWKAMEKLAAISFSVALLEFIVVTDPSSLDPMRFSVIGTVLNVFIGLLLGFFLTSSLDRWFRCVQGLLDLFEAIRGLQMQLLALGVSQEKLDMTMRYGLLSAHLLTASFKIDLEKPSNKAMQELLEELISSKDPMLHVTPTERSMLETLDSNPGIQMWTWVASLLGRMAQSGEIPPMASPTYGRIIQLAQAAQDAMKEVRQVVRVQTPYVYTHTLAMIVHVNNILSAMSFGLTLGACTGSILVHIDPGLHLYKITPEPHHLLIEDAQSIIIQGFKCYVAPMLFHACLEIGIGLTRPFHNEDARIPAERLFQELRQDLQDSCKLANNPPSWEKPTFKVPVQT